VKYIIITCLWLITCSFAYHCGRQARRYPEPFKNLYRVTAYCPCEKCCGKYADGITASGHRIQPGDRFVAAPSEIPFRTLLAIPGYCRGHLVPVLDRGSAIKGNRLDVYFPTHQEALNWGVRYLKVGGVK